MTKFIVLEREWKGTYYLKSALREGCNVLIGGEEDVECADGWAMVLADGPTKKTAKALYDVWLRMQDDDVKGYHWDKKSHCVEVDDVLSGQNTSQKAC
jgi:hypothetical protein